MAQGKEYNEEIWFKRKSGTVQFIGINKEILMGRVSSAKCAASMERYGVTCSSHIYIVTSLLWRTT